MIYLFDDNKYGQMSNNYKVDFTLTLGLYPNHVKWFQSVAIRDINTIISNASCVLIHDSLDPKEDMEALVAMAKKNHLPYCIFSNGFAATIFDGESINKIKKDRLYNNLLNFIDFYKQNNIINLKLLSLGQNYEIEKASIIQDRLISGPLLKFRYDFNYESAFPSGSQEYKDLEELVYLSNINIDYNDFEEIYNSKETTALIMRDLIINMVKIVKQKYEQ